MNRKKEPFLAVYDYGQGGVWAVIWARDAREVELKYPELKLAPERPPWMDGAQRADIELKSSFDIDEAPKGWLATLVESRSKR